MKKIINIEPKLLAKLPAREFAARLMALSPSEGLDLLLDRPDAEAVIQAMPEQDFYLFVKELGGENATSILGFARMEQINHILDLECWDRDQVKAGKTLAWLEAIMVASNQKFLEWLYKVDFELLVILFKKWLTVEILPEDTEYLEVDDSFPSDTIDDQFYFTVTYPQYKDMLKSVLGFLFETHNEFYRELMTHVLSSPEAEIEELAYRFHHGRLADNAIPDFEEAVSIYRPLAPTGLNKNKKVPHDDDAESPSAPFFAMMLVPKHGLLTEALAQVDSPSVRKTLQTEFASLANKIIVADTLAPDNHENLKKAADKATAYVNLALEKICHGDASQAASLLNLAYIEDLFRLASGKIKTVCRQLETLVQTGWLSDWPHGVNLLDQDWYEAVSLLLAPTPMIIRRSTSDKERDEDLIRTRGDLQQAETMVQMLSRISPLYASIESAKEGTWDAMALSLWKKAQHQGLDSITLGSLVMTAAVRKIWQGKWSVMPLPQSHWPDIFPLISRDKINKTISRHCAAIFPDKADLQAAADYLEPILKNYSEDMEAEQHGSPASPHLLPYLLFTDK